MKTFLCGLVGALLINTAVGQAQETPSQEIPVEKATGGSEVSGAETPRSGTIKAVEGSVEPARGFMTKGERQRLEKQTEIAKERQNEESRFKQKAIEKAEEREKRQEELQKQKEEATTSFRKKALERAEERAKKDKEKLEKIQNRESRFSKSAQQKAEEREKKEQERMDRINRRKKQRGK